MFCSSSFSSRDAEAFSVLNSMSILFVLRLSIQILNRDFGPFYQIRWEIKLKKMNLKDKELLERVERLLQPKEKVSGLLNFEPINLKTISRIINKTAIVKRKAQGQETDKERHSAGQTDPFNRESLKGNQALSEIDMSFRSEGQGWEIKPVNMTDCLSDLPDGFDLGTNVFISYFLHALEIERLVLVNKDQHSEALEMDKEIECLEETIRQFNQNSDKKLSEVEQIAQLTIQLRESENGKKYIEEQKKESENLLTEELKEIRGKLTRLENKHKNELQNLREDSDPSTKKEIEKMSNQLQQKIKELNDLTEATNKAQEEHRLSLEREREARAALILENEKTMAKLLEKTENEKESMQREQECAIQSLKADYEQTITKLTDELRQAKCDMGSKQELQGAGGLLGEDLGKEGKNEARDGKEQGNEGVGLKGIEGSGTGGVAGGNGEKGVVEKRGVVEEVELRNIDDTAFSNDHLSINFTIPDSSRGHIKATATSPSNQDFFRSRRSAEKRGSQTNNYQSLLAKSKERHSRGCVSVDKQPAGEEKKSGRGGIVGRQVEKAFVKEMESPRDPIYSSYSRLPEGASHKMYIGSSSMVASAMKRTKANLTLRSSKDNMSTQQKTNQTPLSGTAWHPQGSLIIDQSSITIDSKMVHMSPSYFHMPINQSSYQTPNQHRPQISMNVSCQALGKELRPPIVRIAPGRFYPADLSTPTNSQQPQTIVQSQQYRNHPSVLSNFQKRPDIENNKWVRTVVIGASKEGEDNAALEQSWVGSRVLRTEPGASRDY